MKNSKSLSMKTRDEKLAYLNSLQYSTILKKKENQYYLFVPELSLLVTSNVLEDGYKEMNRQKEDYFKRILDCESEDEITLPRKTNEFNETFHQIKIFTYKLLIVCVLMSLAFTISGSLLVNKLSHSGTSIVSIFKQPIKNIILQLETSLISAPEETRQKRLQKIRRLVEGLRPYSYEIQGLFKSQVK